MHIEGFLHKTLAVVMHKKRLATLTLLVRVVLKSKRLSLTELGRAIDLPIQERSGIRRADRFLGNKKLYEERIGIYNIITKIAVSGCIHPEIIVDWSNIPNTTHNVLRAALVANGRAITLYEEVHPEKKLSNRKVENNFLKKLKKLLPAGYRPVIITDGGFHNNWFKEIVKLGWDYLGRIRGGSGKKYLQEGEKEWKDCKDLFKKATRTPSYVGKVKLCKTNSMETRLYLFKGKAKGRKLLTRWGKKKRDSDSLDYQKAAREPWLLTTSLPLKFSSAKKVVEKYGLRMQIEEGFRDLKSSRYGFGFENAYSKGLARIEILLLISMLASWIAWLVGCAAEQNKMHYQFQSNTVKHRRVLSLFYLGCQIIKRKINIPINIIRAKATINEGTCYVA